MYCGPMGPSASREDALGVERVQVGVRLERRMVKVLKALAEFEGVSLGQLIEKIVLHSFEPVPGQEGEASASPHSVRALAAIEDLRRVYELTYEVHATRHFVEPAEAEKKPTAVRRTRPKAP